MIIFFFLWSLATLLLSIIQIPAHSIDSTVNWAVWLSGASAVVGTAAALFAAIFLKQTLEESQIATKLMRDQLMQNRAYIVLDDITFEPITNSEQQLRTYIVHAEMKNCGMSPAVQASAGIRFGLVKGNYEECLKFPVKGGTTHTLGNGSIKKLSLEYPEEFLRQCFETEEQLRGYVFVRYEYSDVYQNRYVHEITAHIEWPKRALTMAGASLKNASVKYYLSGSRNGETKIASAQHTIS